MALLFLLGSFLILPARNHIHPGHHPYFLASGSLSIPRMPILVSSLLRGGSRNQKSGVLPHVFPESATQNKE